MSTLNVLEELRMQLAEAEYALANAERPEKDTKEYDSWVEQQVAVILELRHDIESFT